MENTMVAMVISELKSLMDLKIFQKLNTYKSSVILTQNKKDRWDSGKPRPPTNYYM